MRFAAIPRSRNALLVTALSISLLFVAPATSGASMSAGRGYASDQLLVKFRPSAGRAGVARALMAAHVSDKSRGVQSFGLLLPPCPPGTSTAKKYVPLPNCAASGPPLSHTKFLSV